MLQNQYSVALGERSTRNVAAAVNQLDYRDRLVDANRAVVSRIRDAVEGVAPDALTRRPPAGGWCIAEVLEHLVISADSYLEMLRTALEGEKGRPPSPNAWWKPTLMGGLLVGSFRSPRRMRAPKIYRPGPTPRPRVLEAFIERQEEVARLITQGSHLDWSRIRVRSPAISLITMNLGDAFAVPVVHAERHAAQIERIKAAIALEV
jgi:hypothetical protein